LLFFKFKNYIKAFTIFCHEKINFLHKLIFLGFTIVTGDSPAAMGFTFKIKTLFYIVTENFLLQKIVENSHLDYFLSSAGGMFATVLQDPGWQPSPEPAAVPQGNQPARSQKHSRLHVSRRSLCPSSKLLLKNSVKS
jgi:hypothetical protein